MSRCFSYLLATVSASAALIATPVLAEMTNPAASTETIPAPPAAGKVKAGQSHMRRMAMLDADKDGRVSWAEFSARMKAAFDRLDANHDGYLDAAELPKGGKRGGLNDKSFGEGTWGKPSGNPPPFVSDPPGH